MTDEPRGIQPFDLIRPSRPLMPAWEPLRHLPTEAEQYAAMRAAREKTARIRGEAETAHNEWRRYRDSAEPVARAAYEIHQPRPGSERVVCDRCMDGGSYDAEPEPWPCDTYTAMRQAADG